jgi:uncharacterized membrane protein YcaP (DUF421 family)
MSIAADPSVVEEWLIASWGELGAVALSTVVVFLAVILYTRLAGLRSFSKMSSFDFAMTVAVGSLMASAAVSSSTALVPALVGLALLYLVQIAIALGRIHFGAEKAVDNTPLLLMDGPNVLEDNLRRARVTPADLRGKLREAGVTDPDQILAVVLETTGDFSVLSGDGPLDRSLLQGVRR